LRGGEEVRGRRFGRRRFGRRRFGRRKRRGKRD
jgi:hypothetical protein